MADNSAPPAEPDSEPAPASPSSWRAYLRTAGRVGLGSTIIIMVLLAIIWWLAAPSGEFRLALDPTIQANEKRAQLAFSIFQRADAAVDEAQAYHARLSFHDSTDPPIEVPPSASPGGHRLADFITNFVVETSVDSESGQIALSLNGIAVLEALYGFVGLHDYFLVIRGLEEVACGEGEIAPCLHVFAQISPSSLRLEEFRGTLDEIGKDLAVLTVRGAVRRAGDSWREETKGQETGPPFLLAVSTPTRMAVLQATANGIAILQLGTAHQFCRNLSPKNCLEIAQKIFESAVDGTRVGMSNNSSAAMGLALIEFNKSLSDARSFRPGREIEERLQKANRWIKEALLSKFLNQALQKPGAIEQFDLMEIDGLALSNDLIERVEDYHCALVKYRRADWNGCLNRMGELDVYPAPIRPYLEAAKLEASLHLASGYDARRRILASIKDIFEVPSSGLTNESDLRRWLLQRIAVKYVCLHPEDMEIQRFEALVTVVMDDAPSFHARQEVMIEAAECGHNVAYPARTDIENIARNLKELDAENARHRQELALAKYYIRIQNLDAAVALAIRALPLPYVGAYVRNSPAFGPLMSSPGHKRDFIEASFASTIRRDDEACRKLEF